MGAHYSSKEKWKTALSASIEAQPRAAFCLLPPSPAFQDLRFAVLAQLLDPSSSLAASPSCRDSGLGALTNPGHGHHSNTSFTVSSDSLSCSLGFLMQLLPQTYRTLGFREPAEHTDFACSHWKNIKILIMVTKQLVSRTRVGFKVIQQKTTQSDTLLTVILFIFLDQMVCLCWNPHQVLPTCSSLAVTWGYWPHVPISYKAECW